MERLVPLSWTYRESFTGLRATSLWVSPHLRFVPFGRHGYGSPHPFLRELEALLMEAPSIIRGIPEGMVEALSRKKYLFLCLGIEGVLPLPSFYPSRSLQSLVRRGLRKGEIRELSSSSTREGRQWNARSSFRLRGLFRRDLSKYFYHFGYFQQGTLQAFITISERAPAHYHLELLNRTKEAPVGAVEALLCHSCENLFRCGGKTLSLGEVPCHGSEIASYRSSVECFLSGTGNAVGAFLLKKSYSPQSLYLFKNKFQPVWRPVYWSVPKKYGLRNLLRIGSVTGINEMLLSGASPPFP